jgi:Tfp pilus assembly protein PilO
MSRREKILLAILLISVLGYIFYQFIYTPQIEEITKLEAEIKSNEQLIQAHLNAKENITVLVKENDEKSIKLEEMLHKYLSNIQQEDIIIYMHEEITNSNVDVDSLVFTDFISIEFDDLEEVPLLDHEISIVNIPIEGTFEEVLAFVNRFWNFEQNVVVSSFSIGRNEDLGGDNVIASLNLDFIKVNDELANKSPFVEWNYGPEKVDNNPFLEKGKNYSYVPTYNFLR